LKTDGGYKPGRVTCTHINHHIQSIASSPASQNVEQVSVLQQRHRHTRFCFADVLENTAETQDSCSFFSPDRQPDVAVQVHSKSLAADVADIRIRCVSGLICLPNRSPEASTEASMGQGVKGRSRFRQ